MPYYFGIDTSNYTTSVAVFDSHKNLIYQQKKLLPVKNGTLGLKQSDAVFSHVRQLSDVINNLFLELPDIKNDIKAIAVSEKPRDTEGSYMPCFLVGKMVAHSIADVLKVPVYDVSHQAGHIIAALYSANILHLYKENFIAFHFSGGTTECLLVNNDNNQNIQIDIIAESDDLKAGQAIDRVGVMLGLPFPAGPELEKLALKSEVEYKIKPSFKATNPSISGLQNKCEAMLKSGEQPCNIAKYAIEYISAVVMIMTENVMKTYGNLPIVYSGGVMSNSIIRKNITKKFGKGYFAEPVYSSDNAAGIAILGAIKGGYYE